MFGVMSVEDGLLAQRSAIVGGAAVVAADNTWPVVLLAMAATIVMLMLSARKGFIAFRFAALSCTNVWFSFGKRGRVLVRVHSFTSSVGANCFVTTSGEFTAKLSKEDETSEGKETDKSNAKFVSSCDAVQGGYIVGTQMVFVYGNASSVFAAGRISGPRRSAGSKVRAGLFVEGVDANFIGERESIFCKSVVRVSEELEVRDSSVERRGRGSREEFFVDKRSAASPLEVLQPLQLVRCEILPLGILRTNAMAAMCEHPWDEAMKLRLRAHRTCRFPARRQESVYSAVLRGANHTATLNRNVVKIWENRSRSAVVSMRLTEGDSNICSLDVDWENETGYLGSSNGLLSLWDLERVTCVNSVSCHMERPITSLHSNASTASANNGLIVTAAGPPPSTDECGVWLWDSRILTEAAAVGSITVSSSPVDEFMLNGFELVARDYFGTISVHDIRMLKSSAVEEVSSLRTKDTAQKLGGLDEEQWWDVGDSDPVLQGEDDFCEDDWVRVGQKENFKVECSSASSASPGVLARCFSAISSTLAR